MEGKEPPGGGYCGTYKLEASLHRAWEGMQFDRQQLCTIDNQPLRIWDPGRLNRDQGPDFLDAEIEIGGIRHHGHVELHLHADDWKRHGHHLDPNYDAVMLHVVLHRGKGPAIRADGSAVPELCLGSRVSAAGKPVKGPALPCAGVGGNHLPAMPGLWLEQGGVRRIEGRAQMLGRKLAELRHDWSQLIWEEVATFLGGPVNGHCFQLLAQRVDWALARKYVFARDCLEALLFGTSGMLEGNALDDYHGHLQECWRYLKAKHRLRSRPIPFKFHRMRPAGFPHVRIAQLASIATTFRPLCGLLEIATLREFAKGWKEASDYWAVRSFFGNRTSRCRKELGEETRHRILVNALAPLCLLDLRGGQWEDQCMSSLGGSHDWPGGALVSRPSFGDGQVSLGVACEPGLPTMGAGVAREGPCRVEGGAIPTLAAEERQLRLTGEHCSHDGDSRIRALVDFLRELPPENNRITRQFIPLDLDPRNALQAQGMLDLHKMKCSQRRCNECEVGRSALGLDRVTRIAGTEAR